MTRALPLYSALGHDRRDLASLLPLPGPMSVYICTQSACNLTCDWCPVSLPTYQRDFGKGRMQTAEFRTILEKLRSSGMLKVVRLYGLGEPLMDPTLDEKIALVAAAGLRSEVTSNGLLLTLAWAKRLIRSGLQYLRISLYDHDRMRVLANVTALRDLRDRLGSPTPLIHVQSFDAPDAAFLGVADSVGSPMIHNWTQFEGAGFNALPHTKAVCPAPFYQLQVTWRGEVLPCCVAPAGFVMGNLLTQSLDEVWHGPAFTALRQEHLERRRVGVCATCNYPETMSDNLDGMRA